MKKLETKSEKDRTQRYIDCYWSLVYGLATADVERVSASNQALLLMLANMASVNALWREAFNFLDIYTEMRKGNMSDEMVMAYGALLRDEVTKMLMDGTIVVE